LIVFNKLFKYFSLLSRVEVFFGDENFLLNAQIIKICLSDTLLTKFDVFNTISEDLDQSLSLLALFMSINHLILHSLLHHVLISSHLYVLFEFLDLIESPDKVVFEIILDVARNYIDRMR